MSSCMKLHKQPQPFPKAGVKRSPVITQAGSDRRPSPKQEQRKVKDFPQVDTSFSPSSKPSSLQRLFSLLLPLLLLQCHKVLILIHLFLLPLPRGPPLTLRQGKD